MALFGSNKKESKAVVATSTKEKGVNNAMTLKVLKRPIISEKALGLESRGEYVFMVESFATKPEVKKEVEKKYGVKVKKVNMMVYKPERVLFRGKVGERTGFKKAMVKLVAGQKIEILPK